MSAATWLGLYPEKPRSPVGPLARVRARNARVEASHATVYGGDLIAKGDVSAPPLGSAALPRRVRPSAPLTHR
jgi:hypothetical protein